MFKKVLFLIFTAGILLFSCQQRETYEWNPDETQAVRNAMKVVTDVMLNDVLPPPVASRVYLYASVAGYESAVHVHEDYRSLAGQLRDLGPGPEPESDLIYDFEVAAASAILKIGEALTFDNKLFHQLKPSVLLEFEKKDIPDAVFERSRDYGRSVARHILDWAKDDYYAQTRTYPKYTPSGERDNWIQTPPAYFDAIEPAWRKIRPAVIDSSNQFVPKPPTEFSIEPESQFYREAHAVFTALDEGDEMEKREIAGFWDCNPFAIESIGHLMVGKKKISPGGHWMNIASLAAELDKADLMKSLDGLAMTSIALFDGFIACWDEKYRSNLLRPETFINRYIDEAWVPALQSPPFPEHTSGHSVISTAASIALTSVYGDDFEFDDTTQLEFDLPVRSFNSFREAADEAAISRFYGGIHYMPAINYGVEQGEKIGNLVTERVTTKRR